ncbi:MAG: hypothetical protein V4438_02800 [Patescibacteria group bacterium]
MNAILIHDLCLNQSVAVPDPAAFALWLRVHLDILPWSQEGDDCSVQAGPSSIWHLKKDASATHLTGENITMFPPEGEYEALIRWFEKQSGVGKLSIGDATHFSIWIEKQIVGFITVKKQA